MYASTTEAPVLLVGTAHVIDLSVPLRRALEGRSLQGIAVELDRERAAVLFAPPAAAGSPARDVPFMLRLWSMIQKRLGDQLGAGAGAEMKAAAGLANEWQVPLFCIDDPIRETLPRLLASLSFKERVSLLLGALVGLFIPARVVQAQIGEYADEPAPVIEQLRTQFPSVARVLLDERNEHMADRLVALRVQGFGRLAAVVGDAHVPGLAEALRRRTIPVETVGFGALRALTGPSAGSSPPA